jgi:hypothetical protein
MATKLIPDGKQSFYDSNGDPLANGTVTYYEPGTTSFKDTWQDRDKTTLNTNPIQLDAAGRCVAWGDGLYRQIVKDAGGNTIWDQVTSSLDDRFGNAVLWGGVSTGTANAQILTVDLLPDDVEGYLIAWIAGYTNTDETTINITDGDNSTGAKAVLKGTPAGPVELIGGEIVEGNLYIMALDTALNAFQLNSHVQTTGDNYTFQKLVFHPALAPTALTGNTNNWNPTGLNDHTRVKISSTQDIDLTGIAAPSDTGHLLLLENWGAFVITLKAASESSVAQNRFDYPNDVRLGADENVLMIYDGAWRVYLVRTADLPGDDDDDGPAGPATDFTIQLFTTSGTWTKPDNLAYVDVTVIGAGGSVWQSSGNPDFGVQSYSGGGGGGSRKVIAGAELGATETVTINQDSGGTSSFGTHLSANAGLDATLTGPGTGGSASGGDINVSGTRGTFGEASNSRVGPDGGRPGIAFGAFGWGGTGGTVPGGNAGRGAAILVINYLTPGE